MRSWRLTANAAFFGLQRDCYTEYHPAISLEDKIARVARVPGITGIELKYPADLEDVPRVQRLLDEHGLTLSAVNVDTKDAAHYRHGALSAADPAARRHAVARLQAGMDVAVAMGVKLVTTCPLADGHEYPFQVDHLAAWDRLTESVREVAAYRPDVRLALEYQPHDMQARPMLANVGKLLHLLARVNLPNVGATLDLGHAIAAGETLAESISLVFQAGALFYIHTNDNTGDGGDWDMISGSVHFWQYLEALYTLDRLGYDGWLGADIKCPQVDAVDAFAANVLMLRRMIALLGRLDPQRMADLVAGPGNTLAILGYLMDHLVAEGTEDVARGA
jgi:xylose isomerase